MFCNGICEKDDKICGLLTEITFEDGKTKEFISKKMCVLHAMYESNIRSERQLDGLHKAENSTRNETADQLNKIGIAQKEGLLKIKEVLGIGMIGLIKKKKFLNKKTESETIKRLTNRE
jgi:hypothetical protein